MESDTPSTPSAKLRPGLVCYHTGADATVILLTDPLRSGSTIYMLPDGTLNADTGDLESPPAGSPLDRIAEDVAAGLRRIGAMSLDFSPRPELATDGAHDLLQLVRDLDALGWKIQSLLKTKVVALGGKLHAISDDVLVDNITTKLEAAQEDLVKLIPHVIMTRNHELTEGGERPGGAK